MTITKSRFWSCVLFLLLGMAAYLTSAYVSDVFTVYYGTSETIAAIEIAPVCEEIIKLLPVLLFLLIFKPSPKELPPAAMAVAAGFAILEYICYLAEHSSEEGIFLVIHGISAGALHILCGILIGVGISYVFRYRWLMLTGSVGLLGACIGLHAIYDLLITADGAWKIAGYGFSLVLIAILLAAKKLLPKVKSLLQ